MGAERLCQAGQIVTFHAGPETDIPLSDDDQIADPVGRQFKACAGFGVGVDFEHAIDPRKALCHIRAVGTAQINRCV